MELVWKKTLEETCLIFKNFSNSVSDGNVKTFCKPVVNPKKEESQLYIVYGFDIETHNTDTVVPNST